MTPLLRPLDRSHRRSRRTPRRGAALASPVAFVGFLAATLLGLLWLPTLGASGEQGPASSLGRPDEVLMVGDSLLYQSRPAFDQHFDDLGVATSWIGGPGEGLLTDQSSWLDQIDHAIETLDPDAVVIEACCNYAQHDDTELYRLPDGSTVVRDSELMYELWEDAARDAVGRAGAGGAEVYVVIAPQPVDGTYFELMVGSRMERFATIWRSLAADTPSIHLVDWTDLFADGGEMVTVLPGVGRVRHDDGLHVIGVGHDLVAERTAAAVLAGHLPRDDG
jgi:hypothetical protein